MERLSPDQMIDRIHEAVPFHAIADDYSFSLKIEEYTHYLCGAVHDGHQFRKELWDNCLHTAYDRWYEEDPCTLDMVRSHPIVIAGRDSRFEYDLNREPENAVFDTAWGKELWRRPLEAHEKAESLQKHHNFYRVVHALVEKLEDIHGSVVVYDIHSYNWKRWERHVPVINIGTVNLDNDRFGQTIEAWRGMLEGLKLPHDIATDANLNDTFFGNGYFLKYITKNFSNTLVLATEFKKIYCDELRQVVFPEVVEAIEQQLRDMVPEHAKLFYAAHR